VRILRFLALVAAAATLAAPGFAGENLFVGFAADVPKWEPDAGYPIARDLGATAFRITATWKPGQTEPTEAQIAELDRAVGSADGMRLVIAVYALSNLEAPQDDAARDQFCGFAQAILARYPTINDVVVWNEPNKQLFWKPQYAADGASAAPAAYEALLARCWDVLHASRPGVNVIAPATSPRGTDNPTATSNVSHSPVEFIRKLGEAYRASGRQQPIFDTVGHHAYGLTSAERPWKQHSGTTISQGDWGKLMQALTDAFGGTGQPIPGECSGGSCVSIWYLETGYQTVIDDAKQALYTGTENVDTIPDYAGGEPSSPAPSPDSPAPDQWTQFVDAIRLAYCQPYVEAYFNFQLWDDPGLAGWQAGPLWVDRTPKDSYPALQQAIGEVTASSVDCAALKGGQTWTPDTTPPGAPANLVAIPDDARVSLDWTDNPEHDLAGYEVYRATAPGGPYVKASVSPVAASAYTDTGVANRTTYYYTVTALDSSGNEGPRAAEVSVTPWAPIVVPYKPLGYRVISGRIRSGKGSVSRLYENDGSRVEIDAAKSGSTYIAEIEPYVSVAQSPAALTKLTVEYDGGASNGSAAIRLSAYNWSTGAWVVVDGPRSSGVTTDTSFTWSTSSPAEFVGPATREIRFLIRGTRSGSFRIRTDWIRFSVEH